VDRGVLHIDVRYIRRDSNDPRNLVFPFYVIPSHGGPPAAIEAGPGGGAGSAGGA
jgi:hypothetical protein